MKKSLIAALVSVGLVAAAAPAFAKGGYVNIYQDKGFGGQVLKVKAGKDIVDFLQMGFNDTCSSVKYYIPSGWTAVLYTDSNFKGRAYTMAGSGSAADVGTFEDKCSSIQWIR
ncbi:MAG TPA: peptidase inhibitor family I36 protein [bacterium]|nr:peptidase inhibitor family I36 protein [bacterium]